MKHYDTIIIGGGISGCVLGYLLKKQNKEVLIIEKLYIKNKDKLCGGLLTKKTYDLLCEIYTEELLSKLPLLKHNKVKISSADQNLEFKNINIYSIDRKDLDNFVLSQYIKIGGEIIEGYTYNSINFKDKILTIKEKKYFYENIVGADGALSKLKKDIIHKKIKNNFAYETKATTNKYNSLIINFFNNFKGYGWIIPNKSNTMVGIGNVNGINKIEKEFSDYLKNLKISKKNNRGAFLPDGKNILLDYKNNVYFIGDAAGLISPITGEGIYYAIYSAFVLSDNMNENYKIKMHQTTKQIKKDLFYLKFIYNTRLRNYLFSKYSKNKIVTKLIDNFIKHIL